jgi:hypothetical protein
MFHYSWQVLRRVWCLFEVFKTISAQDHQGRMDKLLVLAADVNLLGLRDIFIKLDVAGGVWGF